MINTNEALGGSHTPSTGPLTKLLKLIVNGPKGCPSTLVLRHNYSPKQKIDSMSKSASSCGMPGLASHRRLSGLFVVSESNIT